MQRLLSSVFALAFAAALGTSAFAASPTSAPAMTKGTTSSTSCPKGETYVKGYTKSSGTKVAGYCRKSPSTSSAMKSSATPSAMKSSSSMKMSKPTPAATK